MAKFFDDIGKDSDDLLTKDFPSGGSAKVSIETKNDSGVTIAASGRRYLKGKDTLVEGTLDPTWDYAAQNLEVKGKLSTDGKYSGTVTLKDVGSKGSKLSVTTSKGEKGVSFGPGATFKNEAFAFKLGGTYPFNKDLGPSADLSLTATYEKKVHAGAAVSYTLGSEKNAAALLWGIKLGVDEADFQGALHVRNAAKDKKDQLIVGGSWFHKINSSLKVGASAAFDTKQVQGPTVTIADEYKFDDLTSLKGKFSFQAHPDSSKISDIRLGFGIKQLFTKNASVNIGADLNARTLAGQNAGEDHGFGVELKFF